MRSPTTQDYIEAAIRGDIPPVNFITLSFPEQNIQSQLARAIQAIYNKKLPLNAEQVWEMSKNRHILVEFMTIANGIALKTPLMPQKCDIAFRECQMSDEAIEAKRKALLKVLDYLKEKEKEGS